MSMADRVINIPVTEVILFEDRAQVKRSGSVALAGGNCRICIDEVSPVIVDKTLAVKLKEGAKASVVDASICRSLRVRKEEKAGDFTEIEKEVEALTKKRIMLYNKQSLLSSKIESTEQILDLTLSEIPVDVAWGSELSEDQAKRLKGFDNVLLSAGLEGLDLEKKIEDLDEKINDLNLLLNTLRTPATDYGAAINIELSVEKEGSFDLTVVYIVPGACWRPRHRAQLLGNSFSFSMEGCVWQNTGEDWKDVQLHFSTQRISLGVEPPLLMDDIIRTQKKPREEIVEVRDQDIQDSGMGTARSVESEELPGIDDCGTVQNLQAEMKSTVPSNGSPFRVAIAGFEGRAESDIVMMPEMSEYGFLRSIQSNGMKQPILAGPVDLIRDSGFVGRTSVLYIAPGEKFELGWGPDPELSVKRLEKSKEEKAGIAGSWIYKRYTVTVLLSNIGTKSKEVVIQERIPVSEVEKVSIEFDAAGTTGGLSGPDENGMVKWKRRLKSLAQDKIILKYSIKTRKGIAGI